MTTRDEAVALAEALGAKPPFLAAYLHGWIVSEEDLQAAILGDPILREAQQDLATAWAVDLPTLYHRDRWARYARTFAALKEGLR
jgi:hypothetical protein